MVSQKEEIELEMSLPGNLDNYELLELLSTDYRKIKDQIKNLENEWILENE